MKGYKRLASPRVGRFSKAGVKRQTFTAWLFMAPSLCGVAVFLLVPFLETVRRSFCDTLGKQFVGVANYQSVLQNEAFQLAIRNTVRFTSVCVPLLLALSLALALALRAKVLRRTPWAEWYRTTFLLPMAIPVASIALLESPIRTYRAYQCMVWYGLRFYGHRRSFLGVDCYLSMEKHRV